MTTEVLNIVVREDGSRVVQRNIKDIGTAGSTAATGIGLLKKALVGLAAVGITATFGAMISLAGQFETKMAEVSTLVDTATFDMDRLTRSVKEQSIAFGQSPVEQAAASYQIISAGASTAAKATDILTASNKLAIGGVTSVATAADGLTSVLNAYGNKVEGASAVSDALFVGMKAGKTTIQELSGNLGKVAPLAAQAGVGFDELVAGVSALTKGGIKTTEAVTGMRAIMAAVVKPTKEAADMAEKLGLDFSASALASQGFGDFLDNVVTKTGGSTAAMAQLFGGVEALVPALALAGAAGADFDAIMEQMAEKGGATQEAFEKMTNTFEFQSARLKQGLTVALIDLGTVVTNMLTPALKLLADNFEQIKRFVIVFASAVTVALLPAIASATVGFIAMAAAFLATPFGLALAAVTALAAGVAYFGDKQVEVAGRTTTVWQGIGAAVTTAKELYNDFATVVSDLFSGGLEDASGFFTSVSDWLGDFAGDWDISFSSITGFIKNAINVWIGLHVGFITSIGPIIKDGIPALFALAMGGAKNAVLTGVQGIINIFVKGLSGLGYALDFLPGISGLGDGIKEALTVDFSELKTDTDKLKKEFKDTANVIKNEFGEAISTDYVGAVTGALDTVGSALKGKFVANLDKAIAAEKELADAGNDVAEVLPIVAEETDGVGNAATNAAGAVGDLNDQLKLQKQLLDNSVGARQNFVDTLAAAQALLADPSSGFSKSDAFGALTSLIDPSLFAGTQEAIQAQVDQVRVMYEQIDALRQADVISAQTAMQAKAQLDYQLMETRLSNERALYGELAKLSRSGNRTIAAIGKAAAVTQATIDGYLAIQKALASYPPPFNYAMAAAVGTVTAQNIASILSTNANFATGGSFKVGGSGGVDSQMVAIRATPGERVSVQTPTQVRHGTNAANQGNAAQRQRSEEPPVIVPVFDKNEMLNVLSTYEGRRIVYAGLKEDGYL